MTDYVLEISYVPAPELDDRVEAMLFLTTCHGSRIDEREGETVVSCWFPSPADRAAARESLEGVAGLRMEERESEPEDWLDLYRQSLEPIFIGKRFVVVPDASLLDPAPGRDAIVIPQERAFGTGSHESTALCLEMLETCDLAEARGLDVGTGTGILAIGMMRLGAANVFAFDNDLETWEVAPRNLERNGVPAGRIELFVGGVDAVRPGSRFDVVTMNILSDVIVANLPAIAAMLERGGSLILSGVLRGQRDEVVAAAEREGLDLAAERERGDWWCGRFRR